MVTTKSKASKLERALKRLSPRQRADFAHECHTTPGTLRQIAVGRRNASAVVAILIDRTATSWGLNVPRSSLNPGCAMCEYARSCEKSQKGVKR